MSRASDPSASTAPPRQQCAESVLMVRPKAFGFNAEAALTNTFQAAPAAAPQASALQEFEQLVRALRAEGIGVCVAEDSDSPPKPDAIFPNNWVSFHACGTLVLYPLAPANRRPERRQEVIDSALRGSGFRVTHLLDLTWHEAQGRFLEGTGSLVLDHVKRVAYACASPRTDPQLVREWARELNYEPVIFTAVNRGGVPLYHTNVCLWIGSQVAVVAAEAIVAQDRARVLAQLQSSGREIILIGHRELEHFAGNMLELGTWDEALGDARVLVMSESARQALEPRVFAQLAGATDTVLSVPVPTIEKCGGGSVRCMLAEIFKV
jgi:hypothetical protein